MNAEQITEVSATVDACLNQEALDGLNEAERLGLIVGAAYGQALAERDEARAQVAIQAVTIRDLVDAARKVLAIDSLEHLTWAHDEDAVTALREVVQGIGSLDSDQTPTQEA
jgi:hypothetical protein